ncbi:MAG: ABC transporter ATP-binding protein [Bryobacteraceae bacterium]|jgi:ABC-type polysaccharide/polyol phosphate transport system ATPase subunit
MTAIEFEGVSKSFRHHGGRGLLRQRLVDWARSSGRTRFYALKNVSFRLEAGEGMAVVGSNGAGKSTLLSLAAGLAKPDSGRIRINGRMATLLELGSGFHPDLTGAENIRMNASLIGLTRRRTTDLFDGIVDFADIGDFINEPVRTYSTGMIMRLAFSVAINMDPDIMLVDEILAVGDQAFQKKCLDRILAARRQGRTFLCVSHAIALAPELCDNAIWLNHGELMMSGRADEVMDAYKGFTTAPA